MRATFGLARKARTQGPEAREVADLYFFDTAVRVHRRGEGVPHTGLKPAGLDVGPVIPLAEQAVDTGDPIPLIELLQREVAEQTRRRLAHVRQLRDGAAGAVPAVRAYTSAMLGFLVWSHKLWRQIARPPDH